MAGSDDAEMPFKLRYRPRRIACPRCGVRVEDFPWAEPWARVTTALWARDGAPLPAELEKAWPQLARELIAN